MERREMMVKQEREKSRAPEGAKSANPDQAKKPKFELPKVITYSGDDILEELGPAHACSPFSGAVVGC